MFKTVINGKTGVVKHLEFIENKVSTIYIKFDDPDAGKILTTNTINDRINNWIPVKRHKTSIIIRNTNKSANYHGQVLYTRGKRPEFAESS